MLFGPKGAHRIATHLTKQEKLLLYKTTLRLGYNRVIVEIGSYLGASAYFMAAAAGKKNSRVFCVDTWDNDGMTEGRRDTYHEFINNVERYRSVITPIRGRSAEVASTFLEDIDLLFIDGDHSYTSVLQDIKGWLPKLKRGGIVALHDWGWAEGVREAVSETIPPIQIGPAKILPNLYLARVDPSRGHSAQLPQAFI